MRQKRAGEVDGEVRCPRQTSDAHVSKLRRKAGEVALTATNRRVYMRLLFLGSWCPNRFVLEESRAPLLG
jgi:hypothetical protein